jgi:hypothetical protein
MFFVFHQCSWTWNEEPTELTLSTNHANAGALVSDPYLGTLTTWIYVGY